MGAQQPGESADPDRLSGFNELTPDAARAELLACCNSTAWAQQMAAGRPYASLEAVLRHSDAAVASLTAADLADALAGHPRIGERAAAQVSASSAAWSGREQAGVRAAGQDTIDALALANADYEDRFGHIYLVCAAGRSGPELLSLLRTRLLNDPETEWLVVRAELQKINQIRLRGLLAGSA
jgi:2-oxo-4-hydroxy-4-carboxy-5-ureidoimidazoline decarboxylase